MVLTKCLGVDSNGVSLPSIETTSDIIVRSEGLSCMHRSATRMHFMTSLCKGWTSPIEWSISSIAFPSFNNCHAYDLPLSIFSLKRSNTKKITDEVSYSHIQEDSLNHLNTEMMCSSCHLQSQEPAPQSCIHQTY